MVDVITVGTILHSCEHETEPHADVKRHPLRHGFDAKGHWIINNKKIEADLIAIGGFAHSSIRETFLGGVTHDLVEHSEMPMLIVE